MATDDTHGGKIGEAMVASDPQDPFYVQRVRCGRHELFADEPPGTGGADAGPSPFDYLAAALGACTAITLRMYAQRKGWDLGAVQVRVDIERTGEGRRMVRTVRLGGALSGEQRARLADICERTPVTLAVKAGTAIDTQLAVGA